MTTRFISSTYREAPHTYANPWCITNSHSVSDAYANSDRDCDSKSNGNAACYSDPTSYAYTYCYGHARTNDYSLTECEPNLYSKGNAQASPDAPTASDSAASTVDPEVLMMRDE